jgi:hypothetical protein
MVLISASRCCSRPQPVRKLGADVLNGRFREETLNVKNLLDG